MFESLRHVCDVLRVEARVRENDAPILAPLELFSVMIEEAVYQIELFA